MPEYVDVPFSVELRVASLIAFSGLVFTKLGSQLTAEKLSDLAIIPLIFVVQTFVSYMCAFTVSRCFRLKKRAANFVTAMAVRMTLHEAQASPAHSDTGLR